MTVFSPENTVVDTIRFREGRKLLPSIQGTTAKLIGLPNGWKEKPKYAQTSILHHVKTGTTATVSLHFRSLYATYRRILVRFPAHRVPHLLSQAHLLAFLEQEMPTAFDAWAASKTHNAFPTVATRILLKDGEVAFYDAPSALYEKRAVRYWESGSIGFRVARGVYVGGTRGRSVSEQEWGKIDTGTLTITNKRIIFNGGGIDRAVMLANVMAVEPWFDGVEISIEKRQKGMCFATRNPVLVGALINYLARGGSPGVASPAQTRNPQLPPPPRKPSKV